MNFENIILSEGYLTKDPMGPVVASISMTRIIQSIETESN